VLLSVLVGWHLTGSEQGTWGLLMSASQYSETNVMNILFNLLRIKDLYMFRALLAHPQETLHTWHLIYCLRVTSVGCTILVQPTHITRKQYTKYRLCSASWRWASNARNMWGPLILNKLTENCITLVSLYWYTMTQVSKTLMSACYSIVELRSNQP
jgi:hypothetical protein